MFGTIDIFRMSAAMAQHAGKRQAIVAQNVANADTPGYVARDVPAFALTQPTTGRSTLQRASRAAHLHGSIGGGELPTAMRDRDQASPNGNQVSLETEILKSVDAKRQHDRALAIYKTSLGVIRSTLRTN